MNTPPLASRFVLRFALGAACMLALLGTPHLHAQSNYTWDVATGNSTITDGSGTWQVGVGNWYNGTSYDQNWDNGNNVIFGGGTAGAAGTVTLGGDVTTANMTFNSPNGGGAYTIDLAGYTLTLGGSITSTAVNGTTLSNGTISLSGNRNLLLTKTLTIDAKITGAYNLSTSSSPGNLYLNNTANDFTGQVSKTNGGALYLQNIADSGVASSAGAGSSIKASTGGTITFIGAAGTTNRTLDIGNGNNLLFNNGSGALIFTGGFNHSASTSSSVQFAGNYAGTNEFQGNLANKNATVLLSVTKHGTTTWLFSGNNTYTGTTNVSQGTLTLSGNLTTTGAIQTGWTTGGGVLNITGNLTRSGGNLRSFQIAGGNNYNGTVNVSGSGILNAGAGMFLGEDTGGRAVFNQTGGTVNTGGVVFLGVRQAR